MIRTLATIVAILYATHTAAATLTLKDLKAALKARGSSWVAGETSVSNLSREEKKKLAGAILPEGFDEYFINREPQKQRSDLPPQYDWRNVSGTNFASPILNQGRCGSCVAFATTNMLETQMNITRNTPFSPWKYSSQHLFSCGGGGCNKGWQPSSAVSYLKSSGVPDEACYPYASGALGEDMSCSNTCSDSAARSEKILSYFSPTFFWVDIPTIKEALLKGPVMTTYTVYEDFYFYTGGVYQHTTGELLGGHAVTIIGWNDDEKAWIVANSWGDDWGEKGYFRISWSDDSGLGRNTWGVTVPGQDGYVMFDNVKDYDVLHGIAQLRIKSTYPATSKTDWTMKHTRGTTVASGSIRSDDILSLDTSSYSDGIYQLTATASHAGGTSASQPKRVYILNGALTGGLKFTNVTAGSEVTGKFILEFEVNSAPIPFARVTFKATNVSTGKVITKSTTNVAAKMALSWLTQKIDKGQYDLTLEGYAGNGVVTSEPLRIVVK